MNQSTLEALLGRSLTTLEATNKNLYLDIARESLEGLICSSICYEQGTRTFPIREGFKTIFTGIFEEINSVTINGEASTAYTPMQFDNYNGKWFNSIVLDECETGLVTIDADWGLSRVPSDLQRLWALLFAQTSKKYSAARVQSKQVEDFRISFATDMSEDEQFLADNQRTISKYSLCGIGQIRSGKAWQHGYRRI